MTENLRCWRDRKDGAFIPGRRNFFSESGANDACVGDGGRLAALGVTIGMSRAAALVAVRIDRLRRIDVDEADLLGTTGEWQRANTQGARFIL